MPSSVELEVRELEAGQLAEAAGILARGMHDNPTHQRVFGANPTRRARRLASFYACAIPLLHGRATILGVYREGILVGVAAIAEPGRCQPPRFERIRLLPAFLYWEGPLVAIRLRRWMNGWAQHDLSEQHWHLGPAAVDSGVQEQGIGNAVLPQVCDWLDQRAATAYLETERPQNVRLYQRFGFLVIEEATVLGIPCWFMIRRPPTMPLPGVAR